MKMAEWLHEEFGSIQNGSIRGGLALTGKATEGHDHMHLRIATNVALNKTKCLLKILRFFSPIPLSLSSGMQTL